MKKRYKILTLFLLGLFAISIIAGVVSAASIIDNIKGYITGASGGVSDTVKGEISRILLMALVFMIVYSVFSLIPLVPKNEWPHWGLSIVVAVLSFIFITTADIRYILSTYEGLGIALTTVIPLIIVIAFTLKMRDSGFLYAGLINKLVIILFLGYTGIRWATLDIEGSTLIVLYPTTVIALVIWLLIEKRVSKIKQKAGIKGEIELSETLGKDARSLELSAMMREWSKASPTERASSHGQNVKKDILALGKELGVTPEI